MRGIIVLAVGVLAGVSVSCSDADRASDPFTVRDSAGIEIVESTAAMWETGKEWLLGPEPILTIGVAEGAEEYLLFRASVALRLASGEIVVGNGGPRELRFYDLSGRFTHSAGREGQGPGEYRAISTVWRLGPDSLVVFDLSIRRVSVLNGNGDFVRSFTLGQLPTQLVGWFSDGTILARQRGIGSDPERREGLSRSGYLYARHTRDGELVDTLVHRPGSETYFADVEGTLVTMSAPFGRTASEAAVGDRWCYGAADKWEIECFLPDGELTRLIRRRTPNRPITPEKAEDYRQRMEEELGGVPEPMRKTWLDLPLPETMPAYTEFVPDDEGNLWVKEYVWWGEQPVWAVFDSEGRYLGGVTVPSDGRVTHIGADFMLGIWKGEMDEEQVRMYEIVKR